MKQRPAFHLHSLLQRILLLGLIFTSLLTGCSLQSIEQVSVTATPPATFTPLPPSSTPSPTATATITPTRTPTLHPMNILAARQTPYPGSAITIEETLDPGSNYNRYMAWYK